MDMEQKQLIDQFKVIVGDDNVLTDDIKTKYYRSGFRSGGGSALAVVFPNTLVEQWKVIKQCVEANCIIIMQAAKTGLTEGSAPSGNDYDRDVVVINITKMTSLDVDKYQRQVVFASFIKSLYHRGAGGLIYLPRLQLYLAEGKVNAVFPTIIRARIRSACTVAIYPQRFSLAMLTDHAIKFIAELANAFSTFLIQATLILVAYRI